jgi:hypothetical protein
MWHITTTKRMADACLRSYLDGVNGQRARVQTLLDSLTERARVQYTAMLNATTPPNRQALARQHTATVELIRVIERLL